MKKVVPARGPVDFGEVELRACSDKELKEFFGKKVALHIGPIFRSRSAFLEPWGAFRKAIDRLSAKARKKGVRITISPYVPKGVFGAENYADEMNRYVRKLRCAEGGSISAAEMGRQLGVSATAINKWRKARRVLAWRDPARRYRYPAWQISRGAVLAGIDTCAMRLGHIDQDSILEFFLKAGEKDGARPLDILRDGDLDEVESLMTIFLNGQSNDQTEIPF